MSRKVGLAVIIVAIVLIVLSSLVGSVTTIEERLLLEETVSVGAWGWEDIGFQPQGGTLIGEIVGEGPLSFTVYINARTVNYQGEIIYDWAAERVTQANLENIHTGTGTQTLSIYNPNMYSIVVHARINERITLNPYSPLCTSFFIFSISILLPAGLALVFLSMRKKSTVENRAGERS